MNNVSERYADNVTLIFNQKGMGEGFTEMHSRLQIGKYMYALKSQCFKFCFQFRSLFSSNFPGMLLTTVLITDVPGTLIGNICGTKIFVNQTIFCKFLFQKYTTSLVLNELHELTMFSWFLLTTNLNFIKSTQR